MSFRSHFALVFASTLLSFAVAPASAQVAIYGMGSGGFLGSVNAPQGSLVENSGFSAYGGTFGIYDDFAHLGPLHFGVDGRYFTDTSSNNNSYGNKLRGGLGGVRADFHLPVLPLRPYVQAEVGEASTNYGVNPNTSGSLAYQIQGGLDYTIFPHLDLRAEYGGGQMNGFGGNKQALQEAGIGLVVRFF